MLVVIVLESDNLKVVLRMELRYVLLSFALFFLLLKIVFYKEDLLVLLKLSSSIFFIFFLPYFYIMYLWFKELNLVERMVFGIIIGLVINGVFSYYLGLIGLSLSYNYIVIGLISYLLSGLIIYKLIRK